jgi:hypothetical protein
MVEFLPLAGSTMDAHIPPHYRRPHWDRPSHFHSMPLRPADPRWNLSKWQRFKYALKILTGRESFEERMARVYHD